MASFGAGAGAGVLLATALLVGCGGAIAGSWTGDAGGADGAGVWQAATVTAKHAT